MRLFIEQIWSATREGKPLTRRALFFWNILKAISYFYFLGLQLRQWVLSYKKSPHAPACIPVIAVGNLTVGGSGKSVFVSWLVTHAGFERPAVLLRGYKSPVLRSKQSFVVATREKIFGTAHEVGDEPLQIAEQGVDVAIGKNRFKALLKLLFALKPAEPDVVILDDGYQTTTIHKDLSILLVDARAPLENGYLFPASPLRELDYHRADIIVLTHADQAVQPIALLKQNYFPDVKPSCIVAGRHRFSGLVDSQGQLFSLSAGHNVVLCSGIAKPRNFEITVQPLGMNIREHVIFADHHNYKQRDVEKIIATLSMVGSCILLTTEKDWTKLRAFESLFAVHGIACLIVKIAFEFLTSHEYAGFVALMRKKLMDGRPAQ
jgi:tetraacyldisaccharide 4'-kinase